MSTRTKLNPMVRQRRAERRSMIRDLFNLPTVSSAGHWLRVRLELIRRNPRHNGEWKQELFDDTIARFEASQKGVAI